MKQFGAPKGGHACAFEMEDRFAPIALQERIEFFYLQDLIIRAFADLLSHKVSNECTASVNANIHLRILFACFAIGERLMDYRKACLANLFGTSFDIPFKKTFS